MDILKNCLYPFFSLAKSSFFSSLISILMIVTDPMDFVKITQNASAGTAVNNDIHETPVVKKHIMLIIDHIIAHVKAINLTTISVICLILNLRKMYFPLSGFRKTSTLQVISSTALYKNNISSFILSSFPSFLSSFFLNILYLLTYNHTVSSTHLVSYHIFSV